MIERQTTMYLIAARPQALPPRPPIQPPKIVDDPGAIVVLFMLVFIAGMIFGMSIVASNRPLPPPEGGSGPNLPGYERASNQAPPTPANPPPSFTNR